MKIAKNVAAILTPEFYEKAGACLDGVKWPWWESECPWCEHFHGMEAATCAAFPEGIPERYILGGADARHRQVDGDQVGSFIFSEARPCARA